MNKEDAFGEGALSRAVRNRFFKSSADIVVVDGVRWLSDEELIRSIPSNLLLYVTADFETRYGRAKRRKREGEELKTRKQFLKEDEAKNEIFTPQIGSRADWKIENSGNEEELKEKVREFWNKFVLPLL